MKNEINAIKLKDYSEDINSYGVRIDLKSAKFICPYCNVEMKKSGCPLEKPKSIENKVLDAINKRTAVSFVYAAECPKCKNIRLVKQAINVSKSIRKVDLNGRK